MTKSEGGKEPQKNPFAEVSHAAEFNNEKSSMNHTIIKPSEPTLAGGASQSRPGFQALHLILILSAIILGSIPAAASLPADWRWLLPAQVIPPPDYEFDAAYGNSTFVGVGGFYVTTSANGLNWSQALPVPDYFILARSLSGTVRSCPAGAPGSAPR